MHMCTIGLTCCSLLAGVRNSSGAAAGSAARERPSRTDFRRAYLEWLKRQGDSAERSRQFYGDSELDLFLLWTRVAQYGGLEAVSALTLSLSWSKISIQTSSTENSALLPAQLLLAGAP